MRVCNVVKNSIWYDPRVRKQIAAYLESGMDLECVGVTDPRYSSDEVEALSYNVRLAYIDKKYYGEKRTFFMKLQREVITNRQMYHKILAAKPDIIHANDLNALIPAYKAAKKLKCKLIYDTHEIFLENPWIANNKLVKAVWSFYERRLIHKVDIVVCVSNAAASYFSKKYRIPKPMVITNCISASNHIKEPQKKFHPKQILNHGQFYGGRGYDIMIEAAPLLKKNEDLQFVLRGFGPDEQRLRDRTKELDAINVSFEPPVRVEELIPIASKAWVGLAITEAISLNFKLSVSNKLFEYAAAGLPVIMSNIPEHRYLNDKYEFGIILSKDTPEEIVKAVLKLDSNPELYQRCVQNAHIMSEEVNWDKQFAYLLQRIQEH